MTSSSPLAHPDTKRAEPEEGVGHLLLQVVLGTGVVVPGGCQSHATTTNAQNKQELQRIQISPYFYARPLDSEHCGMETYGLVIMITTKRQEYGQQK